MRKIGLILLIIILAGCSLERSNPLDPVQNNVEVPSNVIGIDVSKSSSEKIEITWTAQTDADGYYVYRSMSIDGYYQRIDKDQINSGGIESYTDMEIIPGNWYYYKMSAYKWVDNRRLEGWRSGAKTW